jgi:hypothetical protein
MPTTTTYGTWNTKGDSMTLTVEQSIADYLGEFAKDFDVEAIVEDYREAIDEALPPSVSLCGNEFIGPYYATDCDFGDAPTTEFGDLDLKAIVAEIDLWAIIAKHDSSLTEQEA